MNTDKNTQGQDFITWLHELTTLGYNDNIEISSDHIEPVKLFYKQDKTPEEALVAYKDFLTRWTALHAPGGDFDFKDKYDRDGFPISDNE